jgi:hypothetical protein
MTKLNTLGGPLTPQEMKHIAGGKKVWSASGTSYQFDNGWCTETCYWDEWTATASGVLIKPTGNTYSQVDCTWYVGT